MPREKPQTQETPKPAVPGAAPSNPEEQGDAVLEGATKATEKLAALGGDKMSPFRASEKLTKSLNYLSLRQGIELNHEQLVNVLKDKGFLDPNYDSNADLNALATTVNAIKAMQRSLGVKDDGEIGPKTFAAMEKQKPDIITALKKAQNGGPTTAETEKQKKRPELPTDAKLKIEVKLSQVSDALQMNYKTAADLHTKLFDADGKFIQPINPDDLMAYKTALDNIDKQIKTVWSIEDGLYDYNIPADFELTITNNNGKTTSLDVLHLRNKNFRILEGKLFENEQSHYDYLRMKGGFKNRLAELTKDYKRVVADWIIKFADTQGETAKSFAEAFGDERVPPVVALLGKTRRDFEKDIREGMQKLIAYREQQKPATGGAAAAE